MTSERFRQIGDLYHQALALAPSRRAEFVAAACADDTALRAEVEQLLASNEAAGSFLAQAALAGADGILSDQQAEAMIGQRLGHYRIVTRIGAGGMGEVYLAEDEKLGRNVALKILPPTFAADPERLRRFEREAKAASATDHPNIVAIHEIGHADGLHFIATEFVVGETLRRVIDRSPLAPALALDIARQTASALTASHAAGIVHRDIKPENIMLRPDGYVKVLDFGLAAVAAPVFSAVDSQLPTIPAETMPGTILGTARYMSPEQARGQRVDARTDLWSLGVVLYEMLTGQPPFSGATIPDLLVAILERPLRPLAESLPAAPHLALDLAPLLDRLLAKDRDHRYASAQELVTELKQLQRRAELVAARATEEQEPATIMLAPQVTVPNRTTTLAASADVPAQATVPKQSEIAAPAPATVSSRASLLIAALLMLALIGGAWFWWSRRQPAPASQPSLVALPERSFTYSLTVQKMRDGKSYQAEFPSSGRDFYENGWRFRLHFNSPQAGALYLINEGPTIGGAISYRLLFPQPSVRAASAQVEAGEAVQTGWYQFDQHPGVEKIWVVWAAQAVAELETIKADALTPQHKGAITDAQQRDAVRRLLSRSNLPEPKVIEDEARTQTRVTGCGDLVLYQIALKHH